MARTRPAAAAMTPANELDPAHDTPESADRLMALAGEGGLKPLRLGERSLLPIVQGGMGVGVSAHRLAGSVAALGAMGTISSVDLRRHHPDLMARTRDLAPGEAATQRAKEDINAANLEALAREIEAARRHAGGRGLLAINVMRAVGEYAPSVTRALECGIDAVVVGAGLPLDLPELAQDHPRALLVPILSDARGVQLLVRKWERRKRLPDAIVIEHPRFAGGHLGAAKIADLADPRFDFENVVPQSLAFLRAAGIEKEIPLIAAGGIRCFEDIARVQSLGAAAAQLGTPFAVTHECDAHPEFKRVLAQARDEDLVEFTSVAGLPALAQGLPEGRDEAAERGACQAALHAGFRLPGAMRLARRAGRVGPVLHRHPIGGGAARRREEGAVLPRRGPAALRRSDPERARAARPASDAGRTHAFTRRHRRLNEGAAAPRPCLTGSSGDGRLGSGWRRVRSACVRAR